MTLSPETTEVWLAVKFMVGGGGAETATVTSPAEVPPGPMHVSVYAVLTESAPVLCVPLVALVPLQPPEAVQEVAPVEDQVSVAEPPEVTEAGEAVRVTVGAGGGAVTVTVTLEGVEPPAFEQVRVKVTVVVRFVSV